MFDDSKDYVIFTTRTLPRAHRKVCFEMRELHTSTAEAVDIPQWSSWCQQDLGAPTRLLWPVCRGHGRRVSASLGLLEVRGVTLTCSGHSLHPLPAGRPEHEDSSPLSRRTALPVVHLWIALPGHCKVCQEYHSSQPEVSAALERTCAVPRLLDYHVFCITGIASARAAMQNVLQFDVCYGCSWYLQPGEFIEGSVKYPVTVTAEDLGAAMMEEDMKTTADLQHKVKDDGRE
ncbi:uncharacterized protein LOC119170446 isoform X5 [Rhipicephalus microplus]|uniref:uncharacterized protein LOC119170446 isoform X5 n=1 Tax=Rhipicephalus microplus TaxID=6941 RepID=UPI003F6D62D6